ncbi:hypothetical protein BH11CYA1_BH11CYA1_21130 [soil metagenome]
MQVKYKRIAMTLLLVGILPQAAVVQPAKSQNESVTIELQHGPIDVVPGVATELHSKDVSVRLSALRKLDDMGAGAAPFVPDLIKVVDGIHDGERQQALGILRNIGPEAAAAVPALVQTLDDKQYLRDRAIETLQAIGPDAKEAIPALLHVLQEGNLTSNAEQALAAIGHEAISPLTKSLNDKNPDCRRLCITALGLIAANPKTSPADSSELIVPAITQMLADRNFDVEREACWALEKIGSPAKGSVPSLIKAMSDKSEYIRQFSADALGAIGPQAIGALPVLKKALADDTVRRNARAAIKKIEQGDVE